MSEPAHCKILIIEDDTAIATGLALNLRVEGYVAIVASDGQLGLEMALAERPALIVLDLALPKKNGLEVLAELRDAGDQTPIIILSARDAEHDVVAALKLGADDYVSKPFGLAELLARVSAVLRRAQARSGAAAKEPVGRGEELRFGEVVVGVDTRVVTAAGKEVKLTRLEFDLLLYLAKNPGKVFSRDRLLREVWDVHHDGSPRTVDNFIAQLRSKLEVDPEAPRHLVTVRGAGYRLESMSSLREWLGEGPFALTMSSGFFGFFAHAGMLTVLEDEGFLPSRLSGSSAGALVAGTWAAGVDAAVLAKELLGLRRQDFWDPRPGAGLLRGRLFRDKLESLLIHRDFAACRAPLALSVFDVLRRRTRVIDRGDVAAAIHASCALPFLFQPVRHAGGWLLDGGVLDRPGLAGMPAGTRVLYHHLSSRSPWRAEGSASLKIPVREGLRALDLGVLPRVGPFQLEIGAQAFAAAQKAMKRELAA